RFADTSALRQIPACLTDTTLQFPPFATEFSYTVLMRMLYAFDGSRPLNVEQNRPVPEFRGAQPLDQLLEACLPALEVLVGAELDQASTCTTCVTRCPA